MLDSRFDTSQWEEVEASTSKVDDDEGDLAEGQLTDDGDEDEDEGEQAEEETETLSVNKNLTVEPLSRDELEAFEKKEKRKGIIWISRIPYGMTVAKVRHLLSGFGDVDRIYLQDGREKESGEKRTGRQSKSAHFTEGWVEFTNKKVAKAVAEMLNAEPIGAASGGSGGGKRGKNSGGLGSRRWKDEIWTMKYLSGFKWGMLSEQLANERASRASRVRAELSQSAFEQKDYLRKVERARVMRDKEARRNAREAKAGTSTTDNSTQKSPTQQQNKAKERTFKQREEIVRDVREQRDQTKKRESQEGGSTYSSSKKPKPSHDDKGNLQALQGALSKIF
ncbi:hypothetical protein CBS101457_003570 [Exobasidium rhododendri]|nr:hypothetical protein CBS101457_003570 [Exobasidium rhododendri]